MKHIQNITFVCAPPDLQMLTSLLKADIVPALHEGSEDIRMGRVKPIDAATDAESISVQFVFPTLEQQADWEKNRMMPVLADISARYGQRILFFTTLLEMIEHDV